MLVALDGRPEWLAFAAGGYYATQPYLGRYTPPGRLVDAVAYGVPCAVVAVGWLVRHQLARRADIAEPLPATALPATALPATAEPAEPAVAAELTVSDAGPVPSGEPGPHPAFAGESGPDPAFAADVGREVPV